MTSVFISYSRKNIASARKLTDALKDQNLDFWVDWDDIPPTVDWWKEIERGIEQADIFIFITSPDSSSSKVCNQELAHAAKNGKRLIPIVIGDIKPDEVPSSLSHLNWIYMREIDDYNAGLEKLLTAIRTDFEWVEMHSQLQTKALEWDRNQRDKSFLLRGKELEDAERQLAKNTSKEPHPTDLQRAYVYASRQATDRQRRITTSISLAGMVALAALAVFGFTQAGIATANAKDARKQSATAQAASTLASNNEAVAKANAKTSRAGELAAKSAAIREKNFPVSLLLAIESFKLKNTPQSRGSLLDNAYDNPQLLKYLPQNDESMNSVAFSPDGKILASASEGGKIVILDTVQYQQIHQLEGHKDAVLKIAFSPDGKILASAGKDQSIILWDMISFKPIGKPLTAHNGIVTSLAFSPDGKTLVSGSSDQSVILWDVQSRLPIGDPLIGNGDAITSVAYSPDGGTLVSASGNGRLVLWNTQDFSSQSTLEAGSYIYDIAFKPRSHVLALATCGKVGDNGFCSQGKIILWGVATREAVTQPLIGHEDHVRSLAFSPDGNILASGSWDKTIILWDTKTYQPLNKPLYGHTSYVSGISFSPDGKYFASSGGDKTIILWDVKPHQPIGRQYGLGHQVASSAITSDGKHFASGSNTGTVYLWDLTTDPPTSQPLVGHNNFVNALAFSPNGKILATGSHDTTIILYDVTTGQPIGAPVVGHTELINTLAFSPDGNILASGSWDDQIILWDVTDPANPINIATLSGSSEDVISLAFSPNGKILAAGYKGTEIGDTHENAVVILWDVKTRQPLGQPLTGHSDSVNSVVFSPDGKYLFTGSWDKTILQWDANTRQVIGQPFVGHSDYIYSVAVSADGTMLASGSSDKTVILWDVATHQPIGQPLALHNGEVISVAFSEGDTTLVTSSWDDTVIFWSLEPAAWIEKTCQRVERNFTLAEWAQYFPNETYRRTCLQWPSGK